jgi:small-conductance mechanosensitive channel
LAGTGAEMRKLWDNRTLRGFAIIALIALVVVVLQLEQTLLALGLLASIAFFLAIAYFVYLNWRERRSEIGLWPTRAKVVFYGAALLAVLDLAYYFATRSIRGLDALVFIVVLAICGYSMWRVWRDQHTYS